jgi:hypothetical protein
MRSKLASCSLVVQIGHPQRVLQKQVLEPATTGRKWERRKSTTSSISLRHGTDTKIQDSSYCIARTVWSSATSSVWFPRIDYDCWKHPSGSGWHGYVPKRRTCMQCRDDINIKTFVQSYSIPNFILQRFNDQYRSRWMALNLSGSLLSYWDGDFLYIQGIW